MGPLRPWEKVLGLVMLQTRTKPGLQRKKLLEGPERASHPAQGGLGKNKGPRGGGDFDGDTGGVQSRATMGSGSLTTGAGQRQAQLRARYFPYAFRRLPPPHPTSCVVL